MAVSHTLIPCAKNLSSCTSILYVLFPSAAPFKVCLSSRVNHKLLTALHLQHAPAIVLFEEHVRFMILCEHELSSLSMDVFNSHLNLEQINKVGLTSNL